MKRRLILFLQLFYAGSGICYGGAETTREVIQAAYLYRFLDFVEFPPNAPAGSTSYCLCVMGDAKLSEILTHSVEGKSISGRPVVVRSPTDSDEARTCHLLFITGRKSTVAAQLSKLQLDPILTVSDLPDAQAVGDVVTLNMKGDQMHFDINVDNAKRRKLLISSRLIQLSRSSQ